MMKVKPVFFNGRYYSNYIYLECFMSGMYSSAIKFKPEMIEKCKALLSCKSEFEKMAFKMIDEWPITSKVNLSNKDQNRLAWIGQATCCYCFGCNEITVRTAWNEMSIKKQNAANKTARNVLNNFLKNGTQTEIKF